MACLEDCRVGSGDVVDSDSRVGEEPDKKDGGIGEPDLGRAEALAAKNQHHDGARNAHHSTCSECAQIVFLDSHLCFWSTDR